MVAPRKSVVVASTSSLFIAISLVAKLVPGKLPPPTRDSPASSSALMPFVQPLMVEIMSNAFKLDVPLKVDASAGTNWLELKE